ncbi:hypothetical protein NHX12_006262 [Muraenolepis orangiensis]|uniref:Synapse-associated protein 1 n=1 Tax=Muraenolepis orangiensis TaxID=630683 RepID=A0A9Q0DQP8_9TELE|nr:hypothetical protein NHX12_006262 [Muraenolepis orangiensis]
MFKGLGTWLGLENATSSTTKDDFKDGSGLDGEQDEEKVVQAQDEEKVVQAQDEEDQREPREKDGGPCQESSQEQEKGLGDYFFSFATSATKKISESVSGTAQSLRRSVEDGSMDGLLDKTFLGEFQKEQDKFVQENQAKKSDAAILPWVGYNEEETIQQQILALSADRRNFLRDPPAGVQFHFDMEHMSPLACAMLEEDQLLNRMRFDLVPKLVKEDVFWRNYFYRVSLVKQSAQLTALAAQQQKKEGDEERGAGVSAEEVILTENMRPKTPPVSIGDKQKPTEREEEEISTSPGVSEFVSDAFDGAALDQEDLRKEMEQLVLDKGKKPSHDEETADWEKELQQELQEYEVVTESDNKDDQWDQEIEMMLQNS